MSKTTKEFCSAEKIQICINKGKICNIKTGRCINKPIANASAKTNIVTNTTSINTSLTHEIHINTKKTILDFIKELKKEKFKTAKDVIENIFNKKKDHDDAMSIINKLFNTSIGKDIDSDKENIASKQGYIYELLWDICIKFGITDFTKDTTDHAIGNFNNFQEFKTIKEYIDKYINQGYISSNSGGYSDITFRTKEAIEISSESGKKKIEDKYLYNLITVKYFENENYKKNIKDYDIQNLCPLINQIINKGIDKENVVNILLFVKDKKKFIEICKKSNASSNILIKYISPNGNYENVYDLQDLEICYSKLIKILSDFDFLNTDENYNKFKEQYLNINKKKFIPRFHQELFIEKISDLIEKKQKKILVGAIPRSGKTFIMAGIILDDVIKDKVNGINNFNNYVIITPAPNETLSQYYNTFNDYYDFSNNNIVAINVKDENRPLSSVDLKGEVNKHNVFLISKQRLGFKDKKDNTDKDNEYLKKDIENIKKNINKYFGKDSKFKIIFLDEAHFGMSTSIAKTIFEELDKDEASYKIYVTATYNKPKQKYDIDDKNIIKWDLNDIRLIKNLNIKNFPKVIAHFIEKFGTKILTKILKNNGFILLPKSNIQYESNINVINNIINQYKHFPEPILLTSVWDKDFFDKELEKIGNNKNVGFDMLKLFMVNESGKFKNNEELTQLLEYYFGYYVGDDGRDKVNNFYEKKYEYKKIGIIPIIEEICTNNCRTLQPRHKTTQLWFLPAYNISKITKSLIELLKTKFSHIFKNYIFYIAVDKKDGNGNKGDIPKNVIMMKKAQDIKTEIENLENELLNAEEYKAYEGLIILAGNRLQLGISLKNVDIVSLFTNITASDAIYQMLFRSMTEIEDDIECDGKNYCGRKKYGFMVDLNPQRTLYTIDYLSDMYLDYDKYKSKDKKYELIADLINIDKHKFIDKYNREDKEGHRKYVEAFFKKLYNAWDAKTEDLKNFLLEKNIFNSDFFQSNNDITKLFKIESEKRQNKKPIDDENENEIQKGAIKKKIADIVKPEKTGKKLPSTPELWAYLFAEIISILSLITSYTDEDGNECSLNIKNNDNFIYELDKLIKSIDKDTDLKDIFLHTLIKRIIIKGSIKEEELYNMIKNTMYNISQQKKQSGSGRCCKHGGDLLDINKHIHMKKQKIYNINEPDKLLEFINENLKPKDVEKKVRGEVFTPMKLVGEMLDTLPKEVWKNPDLKWLDPAAGMGNFPVAVYMRLMKGLNGVTGYENDEKRRKHILENMLYMVEIDKTNVFMTRKIFCGKIYKLNIFEGSFIAGEYENIYTTELKFDIIVGNPPYNKNKTPIWNIFINNSFNFLNINGYLLFVTPSGWRDINGEFKSVKNNIYNRNLLILKIHNEKNGLKTFNCETRFDIILVENKNVKKTITEIYYQNILKPDIINIKNLSFIPNGSINFIKKLLANKNEEKVNLLYDACSYHTQQNWINNIQDEKYKYKCIYTINSNSKPTFKYSRIKYIKDIKNLEKKCLIKNIEHFGNSKLIWSNGRIKSVGCYIDKKGLYGLTQFSYAILEKDYNILNILERVFLSKKFKNIMEDCAVTEQSINYKIIALFKKDFYKYFLPKSKSLSLSKNNKSMKKPKYNSI
jgi:hypothetical protein